MTTRQQSDDEIRETLIARAVKARLNGSEVVCDLDALVRAAGDLCAAERLLAAAPSAVPAPALTRCPACQAEARLARPSGWSSCWHCETVFDAAGRAVS